MEEKLRIMKKIIEETDDPLEFERKFGIDPDAPPFSFDEKPCPESDALRKIMKIKSIGKKLKGESDGKQISKPDRE